MDPIIGGALVSAGGSLLGGLLGGKKKNDPLPFGRIRRHAESAGFNPLTALTQTAAVVPAGQNYMGAAIADAGLMLADGMAKKAEQKGEAQKLREQNVELAKKARDLTIRPRVGGIYAGNVSTPSLREAVGGNANAASGSSGSRSGSAGDASGSSGSGSRGLLEVDPGDPRRPVDNNPVTTGPGFMVVDNPYFPRAYIPSVDGDEPLDILEFPIVAGSMAASSIWKNGENMAAGGGPASRPTYPNGRKGPSPNGVTRGSQGYPTGYSRPPRSGAGKKPKRQDFPYISYPMYRPTPSVGPR